jgi:cytochrome c553
VRRILKLCIPAAVAVMLPLAVPAASSVQHEYLDAVRASPDAERGAQLFSGCARCHGDDGGGGADGWVPRLAGQHPRVIIRALVDYRHDNRRDPRMEAIAHTASLRDAQAIADVAAFAAALQPRTPAGTGKAADPESARRIYTVRCSGCHGSTGQGDAQLSVPRLGGQHYAYLLRQFHDAMEGRRPGMAGSHEPLLQDLDQEALQGLADLLSRPVNAAWIYLAALRGFSPRARR